MNADAPRYWPKNPGCAPADSPPEQILRSAAAELGPATGFEVVAQVRTRAEGEWLQHQFYLISEPIEYRYLLFRVRHRLGFPVIIFDGPEDPSSEPSSTDQPVADEIECKTADELEQALKQLFEHPTTQRIVGQLRNLSREAS